uniref:WEB family protein At3g51220-like n=1 Tax=Erigeron canadensis TaxID=72917 RepID=UPI001CB9CCBC|nr:WEB family protein At3g51220-like [Erigeron canadensis]
MEEGLVVRGRVEIDSRQPFKSVKEAVLLFGEKVLANEVYANKLKKMENVARENNQKISQKGLGEEKHIPEDSKDEKKLMAYYLMSLKQQLEETKSELNHLRSTREPHPSHHEPNDTDIEEIKFIQNANPTRLKQQVEDKYKHDDDNNVTELKLKTTREFDIPLPTKVIVEVPKIQGNTSSFKTKKAKKKTFIPSLGRMFSKSKR